MTVANMTTSDIKSANQGEHEDEDDHEDDHEHKGVIARSWVEARRVISPKNVGARAHVPESPPILVKMHKTSRLTLT
jgi:hypothetical protein